MRRFAPAVAVSLLAFASIATAQEIDVSRRFDWQTGTLDIEMEATIDRQSANAPAAMFRAQEQIEREFASALFTSLLPLRVDSVRIVEDAVRARPSLAADIAQLAALADREVPRPSPDLGMVSRRYRVPIFPDFVNLFVTHSIPFEMERVVNWVPTREFTGVVIYAADPLPFRGTGSQTLLAPALLPEIYDTNLRPVLEQDMLSPDAIRRWGVVAYSEEADEQPWRNRIGTAPLRIRARQAYGVLPTDIVIGPEDADRLLASPHNRELLREGRVLVVLAEGQGTVTVSD